MREFLLESTIAQELTEMMQIDFDVHLLRWKHIHLLRHPKLVQSVS